MTLAERGQVSYQLAASKGLGVLSAAEGVEAEVTGLLTWMFCQASTPWLRATYSHVGSAKSPLQAQREGLTHDALGSVEGLDDGGDAREELQETNPEEELLHSSLLDGEVVKLHHGCASELNLEAGDGVEVLKSGWVSALGFIWVYKVQI
jgi:hypothetical protein